MRIRDFLPPKLREVYWEGRALLEPFSKRLEYSIRLNVFRIRHKGAWRAVVRDCVPIDSINPFDAMHLDIDEEHRQGIEVLKKEVTLGRSIRPILVCSYDNKRFADHCGKFYDERLGVARNCDYQRLDGFKRYMALKELGFKTIDIIFDDDAFPGGQHRMPWYEESEEKTNSEYLFIKQLGNSVFSYNRF